jgi:hypothetical protein
MAPPLLNGKRVRWRLLLSFALTLAAPAAARADLETGVAMQLNPALTVARTVRDVSAPSPDFNAMPGLSATAELTKGAGVLGIVTGAAWGWSIYRFDGFLGLTGGAELAGRRALVRLVGEGGLHVLTGAGGTFQNDADMPIAVLPYFGARAAVEAQTGARRRHSIGLSAFVRVDAEHAVVNGTLHHRCGFVDLLCSESTYPISREVGGLMMGFSVSLTWWSDAWFRAPDR